MTIDNFEEDPIPPRLSDDKDIMDTIWFAAGAMADVETSIPEEDLDTSVVSINAGKLYDMIEVLLGYANIYEDVPTDEMLEMADIERSTGAYKFNSTEEH